MTFFAPFCIPFMIGAAVMFIVLLWKLSLIHISEPTRP